MSGITGIKAELKKIMTEANFAASEVQKEGVRVTLFAVIETTVHSSSDAAYNWRVVSLGGSAPYQDFHNKFPVGDYYESRSRSDDIQAIRSVAAFAVEREGSNFIDQITELTPMSLVNSLNDIDINHAFNAQLTQAINNVQSNFQGLEEKVKRAVKLSRVGNSIES